MIAGRYRVGDLLGRGGMADVYDGLDLRLERAVAVKLLRPEMAARDDVRTRFEAEARAAAGLSHPNAVAVFDTGEHEGVPYLVMERLPGTTLAERIADGPVDQAWLCQAATGVLGALAVAHQAGIVHRDVKPGNILLAADGTAKIADFGIAKSVSPSEGSTDGRRDLTATGQLLGTPAYLAPERIEGHPATPRSDLWALGVVLYEALAGEKPFTGRTPLDVASSVVAGKHVPLRDRCPGVDPMLAATVEKAMDPDPDRRFATAGEMADALRNGSDATVLDRNGTMILPAGAVAAARRRPGRSPLWARYPWLGWGVLGLLVLALILALARSDGSPERTAAEAGAGESTESTESTTATTAASPGATLAKSLRDVAAAVSPDRDGARAGDLADGLRRVADAVESGSPGAGTHATGLIISAATWHQTGQLSQAATVAAVQVLQQVPGVQIASAPAPVTPSAPAAVSSGGSATDRSESNANAGDGNADRGKDKDRGRDRDDDD
ncbi:MAG: serine/threonine-protein kinase [Acidimicrobiia bacterium]